MYVHTHTTTTESPYPAPENVMCVSKELASLVTCHAYSGTISQTYRNFNLPDITSLYIIILIIVEQGPVLLGSSLLIRALWY